MALDLDLQPGLDCQALIWRKFGRSVNVRVGFEHERLRLVVSFGRCKLPLNPVSVGSLLQATIGGVAATFNVSQLSDLVFSFEVASSGFLCLQPAAFLM